MQDMDEQEENAKLVLGIIAFPNQILKFVCQTKFMQDMDEQEANAKLVLGTIIFPNQIKCKIFPPNQIHAGHG